MGGGGGDRPINPHSLWIHQCPGREQRWFTVRKSWFWRESMDLEHAAQSTGKGHYSVEIIHVPSSLSHYSPIKKNELGDLAKVLRVGGGKEGIREKNFKHRSSGLKTDGVILSVFLEVQIIPNKLTGSFF